MRSDNVRRAIPEVDTRRGAPMGRNNVDTRLRATHKDGSQNLVLEYLGKEKMYNKRVPMSSCGAYDIGGAYWGIGSELRVQFNRDLTFIKFYRL